MYENTCSNTGKSHIGNTQQHYKKRMLKHNCEAIAQLKEGSRSDSFAKHYSKQMTNFKKFENTAIHKLLRNSYTSKVLWQGNSISTVKTFGTSHCVLCNQERLHIFYRFKKDPGKLINFCNQIFGACKHKTRFHRYKST